MEESIYEILGKIATILLVAFFISLVFALPVMWLWNTTLPELFGFKTIDWWMAWKLNMLVGFITPVKLHSKIKEQ
jgi:hypothetical protein